MDNPDDRGWGPPPTCDALDPDGRECALEAGHEGNHLSATDLPVTGTDLAVQVGAVVILVFLVGLILPLPVDGIGRLLICGAIVIATVVWLRRPR